MRVGGRRACRGGLLSSHPFPRWSLHCSGLPEPLVLNNLDWFGGMGLLTFLREIGGQRKPLLPSTAAANVM